MPFSAQSLKLSSKLRATSIAVARNMPKKIMIIIAVNSCNMAASPPKGTPLNGDVPIVSDSYYFF